MASTKQHAPVLAVLISLHLVVCCGAARQHAKSDPPCGSGGGDSSVPGMRHKQGHHPSCSSAAMSKVVELPAVMTVNGFQQGKEGGPSECDGHYHNDSEMLVALNAEFYIHGRRCFRLIRIRSSQTGRFVEAKVVDECENGCEITTSAAVWKALGLDTNAGEVPVTWTDL